MHAVDQRHARFFKVRRGDVGEDQELIDQLFAYCRPG